LARAIAVFQFGAVIGSGLALLVGGAVYRYFLDGGASFAFMAGLEPWQKTFIALASPGLVMVTLLCLLRDKPSHEHVTEEGKGKRDYGPILRNMPQYVLISLGMSLMAVASYGCLSWMPTIIAREFGWSAARIGSAYGILMIVVSPPGLYLGGWLSDTLVDRGYRNAHALVALLSACVTLPPAIALVFMGSPVGLLCMVGIIHFGVCLAAGSTPAYIQIVTPRHARSLMSGIYILVLNAMGLGVGPTLIGYLSSRNGDVPEGLRTALTQAVIPALILSIILVGTLAWRERTSQAAPALDGAAVSG
jgi:MFS family permease